MADIKETAAIIIVAVLALFFIMAIAGFVGALITGSP